MVQRTEDPPLTEHLPTGKGGVVAVCKPATRPQRVAHVHRGSCRPIDIDVRIEKQGVDGSVPIRRGTVAMRPEATPTKEAATLDLHIMGGISVLRVREVEDNKLVFCSLPTLGKDVASRKLQSPGWI